MASTTDPFISVQDLIDHLGRGGTADQGLVQAADAACDVCRTVAEQTFNRIVGGTVILDGTGTDALLLPERPATAAGTVTIDGGTITDYVLRNDGVLIRKTSGSSHRTVTWPDGRQNVTVVYDHGYVDADMPRDIRMVALSIASRIAVQGPAKSEAIGNVNVTYAVASTELTTGELMILRKYRRGG